MRRPTLPSLNVQALVTEQMLGAESVIVQIVSNLQFTNPNLLNFRGMNCS